MLLGFLLTAAAVASPIDGHDAHDHGSLEGLSLEVRAERAWDGFVSHFVELEPTSTREWSCATQLVMEIRNSWDGLSEEQQEEITATLTPWKDDFMAPMEAAPPPPPGAAPSSTCFETSRPSGTGTGENRIDSEHFSVQWDNSISQATAQSLSDALELSWDIEIDEMDWMVPEKAGLYLTLVYVSDQSMGGAYTTIERCGSAYVPYIVVGKDSFWGTWYQDMAAHEFNHAIQFSYGFGHEFWLWEATATWIEEYVYPSHDAWADYIAGYTQNPHLELAADNRNSQTEFMHMYGMAILAFYLDEYVGGPDFVREVWEESRGTNEFYGLWIGDVIEDLGHDWDEVYAGFVAANTVMDYHDGAEMPSVKIQEKVSSLPASGASESKTEPEAFGQNYIRVATSSATAALPGMEVSFTGDTSVDWLVELVGTLDDRVVEKVVVPVDDMGVAVGQIEAIADYDHVWLVVSPISLKNKSYSYEWDLTLIEAPIEEDTGGDEEVGGCGCSSSPSGFGGFASLIGFAGLALSRRRQRG